MELLPRYRGSLLPWLMRGAFWRFRSLSDRIPIFFGDSTLAASTAVAAEQHTRSLGHPRIDAMKAVLHPFWETPFSQKTDVDPAISAL